MSYEEFRAASEEAARNLPPSGDELNRIYSQSQQKAAMLFGGALSAVLLCAIVFPKVKSGLPFEPIFIAVVSKLIFPVMGLSLVGILASLAWFRTRSPTISPQSSPVDRHIFLGKSVTLGMFYFFVFLGMLSEATILAIKIFCTSCFQ